MWGSRIKLIICRKLISHYTNTKVRRFTSVSAAIQTSPTLEQQLLPISTQNPTITSHEHFHELDTVGVLEILNNLKLEPDQALSFFRQVKDYECCNNIKCYSSIVRILSGSGLDRKLASLFLELIESKEKYPHFDVSALFESLDESSEYSGDSEQSTLSPMNQVVNVLVKTYADLGMFDDAIDALFQTGRHGFVPPAQCCNYIMNCLVVCGKTDMALALFQHLKKRLGLTPDVYSYTIVIKAYCKRGDLEEAVDVFRDMDEAGITDAYARTTLIDGLRLNGKTTSGYEVLQAWREAGLLVDAYGYNAVIRGFCSEMKLQEAESVLQEMRNLGVPRDTYSYSNLICGYCEIGNILKAFSIHKDMVSDGVKSNCFIASAMLQCLCKMGLTAEVVDYFQWFKDSGMFLDEVSYNIVIDAYCKLGEMQEAEDLLDEMKGKRMVPDVIHYTCLINGYCRQQDLQSALDILKEMKDLGVKADIITYNILLGEMYRNGYAGAANDLFEFMEAQGLKPNNDTYCTIIKGLCKGGMVKEAREFFNSLEEKCVITCSAMINGYCEADHTHEAHRLFVGLLSKYGILVSKRACLNLLDKLCMEGNMNAALEAFEKMWGLGLIFDEIAYSKFIAALCRYGNTQKARTVFDILLNKGFTLDAQTYTTIMNGYCKENCLREASDLFNDMKEKGIRPDVVTYTVLIKGALEENRKKLLLKKRKADLKTCNSYSTSEGTEDACALQREVNIMDVTHDVVYYTVLIDGHCKMNNLQDAVRLFEEMMDRGITPDAIAYTALVSGYCRRGDVDSAVCLVDEMTSKGIMPDTPTISALLGGYEIVEARKVKLRPDKLERTQ